MTPIQKRAERVRAIALESVLRQAGAQPDPRDRHKWHTAQGVLSVSGSKFMDWTRGTGGGGAIDLVIHLHDRGFMEALEWLEQHFAAAASTSSFEPLARIPFKLPAPTSEKLGRVQDYLIWQRHLPAALVLRLIDSGQIYADSKANAVFLLRGQRNHPVGAELRGTTSCSWRGLAPGSRKDLGYFAIGPATAPLIILCESAIDAISCCALFAQSRCISTAGARPNPPWLASLINSAIGCYCGFDDDPTGNAMAQALIDRFPSVKRLRPKKKDWNDVLRAS